MTESFDLYIDIAIAEYWDFAVTCPYEVSMAGSSKIHKALKICIAVAESRSTEFFKGYGAEDVPKDALNAGDNS